MAWITCPHCGEKRDTSNRYTSPANARLAAEQWKAQHESGACRLREYHVEYRIEVEAESPEEAAEMVASILSEAAHEGVYHVRLHDDGGPGRERAEVAIDLSERTCAECGDTVHTLSTDNLCDGCVEERENTEPCENCGERVPNGTLHHGMCSGCLHDAYRSGWDGHCEDCTHTNKEN